MWLHWPWLLKDNSGLGTIHNPRRLLVDALLGSCLSALGLCWHWWSFSSHKGKNPSLGWGWTTAVEGEALFLYQSVCFLGTELIYLEQYEPRQLLWSIWKSYSSAPMSHLAAVPLGSEFATKCDEKHGPFITVNRVPMSGRKWSVVQVRTLCPCQEPRGVALMGFWSELLLLCKIECHSFSLSLDLITRQWISLVSIFIHALISCLLNSQYVPFLGTITR